MRELRSGKPGKPPNGSPGGELVGSAIFKLRFLQGYLTEHFAHQFHCLVLDRLTAAARIGLFFGGGSRLVLGDDALEDAIEIVPRCRRRRRPLRCRCRGGGGRGRGRCRWLYWWRCRSSNRWRRRRRWSRRRSAALGYGGRRGRDGTTRCGRGGS